MTDENGFAVTTRWHVVSRLREEILSGRMPYGTRLRQAEIAARFGISTTPVREAFRELATLGLVEIQPHRGAVVHPPSGQELEHIYEVRILLEPVSAAWAASRITSDAIAKARKLLGTMRRLTDPDAAAAINRQFHGLIAVASGNSHLSDLVTNLLDLSTPYIVRIRKSSPDEPKRQAAEHEEILAACERRDPVAAYRASLHHLTRLRQDIDDDVQPGLHDRWLPFELPAWLAPEEGQAI